jgi:hypothetical protein
VAARSKAWVCGRWPVEIVGSNLMEVFCCECCVLSGIGLCDELITRPEESYRLWCVVVCDLGNLRMRRPWPNWGCHATNKQISNISDYSKVIYRITGMLLLCVFLRCAVCFRKVYL